MNRFQFKLNRYRTVHQIMCNNDNPLIEIYLIWRYLERYPPPHSTVWQACSSYICEAATMIIIFCPCRMIMTSSLTGQSPPTHPAYFKLSVQPLCRRACDSNDNIWCACPSSSSLFHYQKPLVEVDVNWNLLGLWGNSFPPCRWMCPPLGWHSYCSSYRWNMKEFVRWCWEGGGGQGGFYFTFKTRKRKSVSVIIWH